MAASKRFTFLILSLLLAAGRLPAPSQRVDDPYPEYNARENRDPWQRPADVMDALGIGPGDWVADIGAGSGYFTFHLAERVGPSGKVFANEIDERDLQVIRQYLEEKDFPQVELLLGKVGDPRLPPGKLDAILVVDTYHEFRQPAGMLEGFYRALKPGGRLGIIDGEAEAGLIRADYHHKHAISKQRVRREATRQGFVFRDERPGFQDTEFYHKRFFFLVFTKPAAR